MRFGAYIATSILFSASVVVHAESFDFNFGTAANTFSGSGVLTVGMPEAPGEYLLTNISGTVQTTVNGPELTIARLLPPGTFPTPSNGGAFPANDNTLFVANDAGKFSQDGVSFLLSDGAQINLYNDGPGDDAFLERSNGRTVFEDAPISITAVAAAPEPSSLLLLGTGLLGATGLWRRLRA